MGGAKFNGGSNIKLSQFCGFGSGVQAMVDGCGWMSGVLVLLKQARVPVQHGRHDKWRPSFSSDSARS